MSNADCKNGWRESPYEFSGLMLAPDEDYVRKKHPGYTLTFIGQPDPFGDWYWFWFKGVEADSG